MKSIYLLLCSIIIVISFNSFSSDKMTSEQAYDKAQQLRNEANLIVDNKPEKAGLAQAEDSLVKALTFVRQENIKAMYSSNKYLAARQWDILRDLIKVNSMQKDKVEAVMYLKDLSASGNGLYWVAEDEAIVSLLGGNILFKNIVAKEQAWARIQSTKNFNSNYQQNISDTEKLAGLSLLWAEIKQGFVFFDQVPQLNWDEKFKEFIPIVLKTVSTKEYYDELIRMIAQLKDAHTNVYYPRELYKKTYSRPPLRATLINGNVIVTDIYSDLLRSTGLEVGDEILRVDNLEVHKFVQSKVMPFQSSSTPQDLDVRSYTYALLSGDSQQPVILKIKKKDGSFRTMSILRKEYGDEKYPATNSFKLINDKYAYFRTNSFSSNETVLSFEKIIPNLDKAEGLIIDIRNNGGGSSDIGFKILSFLTKKNIVGSMSFSRKNNPVERAWGNYSTSWEKLEESTFSNNQEYTFNKPVIVLAGAKTFSAAEDFLIAFKQLNRGLIIGEITGGSSGQPLLFSLPGGGTARVCVKREKYQSGEDWVGTGISPDIVVKPSIFDIQNDLDPVLKKALLMFKNTFPVYNEKL